MRVAAHGHTRSPFERIGAAFGSQGATPIDAEFDRHFVVTCSDAALASRLLDDRVRAALDRLRAFGDVSITVRGNAVRVNVHRDLALMHRQSRRERDAESLTGFLTDACTIVDAAAAIR